MKSLDLSACRMNFRIWTLCRRHRFPRFVGSGEQISGYLEGG
jgi:hypothetical protein